MPKLFNSRQFAQGFCFGSIPRFIGIFLLLLIGCGASHAYSVLTHEELIDLLWNDHLRPMILARYPGLTDDQMREAHAYAYGGAVIQDMGYYPFGNKEFSDLVHYVRSGDFVLELIKESQNADEYAFALGALSHYAADITGHPAVNEAVAITYPKFRAKFGPIVLYAQDKTAHIRTEFGFDMAQVAKERYAPQQYHDFIGFRGLEGAAGARLPRRLRNAVERRGAARRSGHRLVPLFREHADSAYDAGGASHAQEGNHARGAELPEEEVPLSTVSSRL